MEHAGSRETRSFLSRRRRHLAGALALLAPLVLLTCGRATTPPEAGPARAVEDRDRAPATVTLLYTTDEHGWLLPSHEQGEVRGGAAELLAQWITREGHCPGSPGARTPEVQACKDPGTLALSGGDNATGPAISSYFQGVPMAEAMGRMGYAASAFGNHEFDFGSAGFLRNRSVSGMSYLAANLKVRGQGLAALELPAFAIYERRGIRIGVIGLATEDTLRTAMASRFDGIELESEEAALERVVPEAWRAEPDALVLIAHECPTKLEPILARHPEWRFSFVGGGHCHKKSETRVGDAPLVNPGWRLRSYARVQLEVDPRRPLGKRVLSNKAEIVEVSHPEGEAPADEGVARVGATWQAQLEQALGEPIGYTGGMERDSRALSHWIGTSWREVLGVDVAILNKGGIRQAVPRGEITKATVYSVLPFDNKLLVCSLKGREIVQHLGHREAVGVGITPGRNGRFTLDGGRPLDEDATYTVATVDFLYFGGDGFTFQGQDPSPRWTGVDWREPVISYTRTLVTTPTAPLEHKIH
ncbi:bifunctional metallophosphatase/5'-nucleotidase [Chondromyces crocatus]|uniref:bifunctional metallophosphatase/5'-nucleotidase n=1 Tax=Chondromyces crocatus TaxID=52 RepID=UPI00067AF69D|nr:5'-nucleotidase C-terminal domain-containing protein [Chondromyces crocatus]